MGAVCSSPNIITPYTQNSSIFIFSEPNTFTTLYTISERILSDTQSTQIRLCRKNSTNTIYVLKTVKSSAMSLEARILKTLNHPNIVKFIQCFAFSQQSLIVLEYLNNEDLGQYLKKFGRVSENLASQIIRQVLTGLSYLHSVGVYHRDIKPENILLNEITDCEIECKICDFDSAGYIRSRDKEPYGTLPYMAPEIFSQKYDEKVDIWSTGVLLFKLLTGHLPFFGKNPEEIELKIRNASIPLNPLIPHPAQILLSNLLTKDPTQRISAQQALHDPWLTRKPFPMNLMNENNNLTVKS